MGQQAERSASVGAGQRANYAAPGNLAARQGLFDFVDPGRCLGSGPLDAVEWAGIKRVLDVGCGNGLWLHRLAEHHTPSYVVGCDLSAGMVEAARRRVPSAGCLVGDAQALPHPDRSFDAVLALWVLYHVPDVVAALGEIGRVLRPTGVFVATTNSAAAGALEGLAARAIGAAIGRDIPRVLPPLAFSAENAHATLAASFTTVEEVVSVTAFAVPSADPVIGALASIRGPIETYLGGPLDWATVERHARRIVGSVLETSGVFRLELRASHFVCRKAAERTG